jgi:hypothetical protein
MFVILGVLDVIHIHVFEQTEPMISAGDLIASECMFVCTCREYDSQVFWLLRRSEDGDAEFLHICSVHVSALHLFLVTAFLRLSINFIFASYVTTQIFVQQSAVKRQKATTVTFINGSKESMKVEQGRNDTVKVKVADAVCLQVSFFS